MHHTLESQRDLTLGSLSSMIKEEEEEEVRNTAATQIGLRK